MTKNERIALLIFGPACNLSELSRLTGIPASTLSRWRRSPDSIPLGALRDILWETGAGADEIERIVKGRP